MEQTKHFKKRDAILTCLRGTTTHPSAEWIYMQLKDEIPKLSLGTVYRNLAYIKEAGKALRIYEAEASDMVARIPLEMVTETRIELNQMSLQALQEAFLRVLLRAERNEVAQPATRRIERDTFTIGECMLQIRRRVMLYKRVEFFDLFPQDATRSEIVTTFLAMLELLKANQIRITQEDIYASIVIEEGKEGLKDGNDADGADIGG